MQLVIDIVTDRKDIFNALLDSEDDQSIIGISSDELGPGMYMTSVKEIIDEGGDMLIVLNSYDTSGYFLEKNKVQFSTITGVIPFKAVFINPFLKVLEGEENQETPKGQKNEPDYIM